MVVDVYTDLVADVSHVSLVEARSVSLGHCSRRQELEHSAAVPAAYSCTVMGAGGS